MKLYGGITIACFLIMGGLFSFRGFLEERTRGAMVSQTERYLGRKLTEQDAATIEKRFGIKINTSGGDTSVEVKPGRENVFKEQKFSEMVDRYDSGKVDPTDIEKAKRALREQR
jgi:phenylalanyl-tRNA synthetase beta subunit